MGGQGLVLHSQAAAGQAPSLVCGTHCAWAHPESTAFGRPRNLESFHTGHTGKFPQGTGHTRKLSRLRGPAFVSMQRNAKKCMAWAFFKPTTSRVLKLGLAKTFVCIYHGMVITASKHKYTRQPRPNRDHSHAKCDPPSPPPHTRCLLDPRWCALERSYHSLIAPLVPGTVRSWETSARALSTTQ